MQDTMKHFEHNGPEMLNVKGLSHALIGMYKSGEAAQVLTGCLALMVALESGLDGVDLAPLGEETMHSALGAALAAAASPIVVASAARALCMLSAVLPVSSTGGKDDRQPRPRRVLPLLRSSLEAHPRALVVQDAFVRGCCSILSAEQPLLGSHGGAIWSLLWPLALHQRPEIAEAACLCLCRLTWVAKTGKQHENTEVQPVPSLEVALGTACSELGEVFSLLQGSRSVANEGSLAQLHAARLLELLRRFVIFARSAVQSPHASEKSGKREKQESDVSMIMLPMTSLVASVGNIFAAVFHNTNSISSAIPNGGGDAANMSLVFDRALELVATLASVAGVALMPYTSSVRKWIGHLAEAPLALYEHHCWPVCTAVVALAQACPAVLLSRLLLERLVRHQLSTLKAVETWAVTASSSGSKAPPRKKRRTVEALASMTMGPTAGDRAEATSSFASATCELRRRLNSFEAACTMLRRLLLLGAPMLKGPLVGSICEQVVRILWLGLATPDSLGGVAGRDEDASAIAACSHVCRDASSMLAMIGVVEALHQTPRLGVVPLAPNLVNAFSVLLEALAVEHQRRNASLPSHGESFCGTSVSWRAMQVRGSLLAAGAGVPLPPPSAAVPVISISWPEPVLVAAGVAGQAPEVPPQGEAPAAAAAAAVPDMDGDSSAPWVPPPVQPVQPQQVAPLPVAAARPVAEAAPPVPSSPASKKRSEPPARTTAVEAVPAPAFAAAAPSLLATAVQGLGKAMGLSPSQQSEVLKAPPREPAVPSALAKEAAELAASSGNPLLTESASLELFPGDDGSDLSPIPSLCMDSPDTDDKELLP